MICPNGSKDDICDQLIRAAYDRFGSIATEDGGARSFAAGSLYTSGVGSDASPRMHGQRRYKDPRYAVSRPPMVTAAHNRQVTETSLRPREETTPFASQTAASRFMVS